MSKSHDKLRRHAAGVIGKASSEKAKQVALEVLAQIPDSEIPSVCESYDGAIGFRFCRDSVEITVDRGGHVLVHLCHGAHRSRHLGDLVEDAINGWQRDSIEIETTQGVRGTFDARNDRIILSNGTTRNLDISRMHVGTPKEWAEHPNGGPYDSEWRTLCLSDGETIIYRRIS